MFRWDHDWIFSGLLKYMLGRYAINCSIFFYYASFWEKIVQKHTKRGIYLANQFLRNFLQVICGTNFNLEIYLTVAVISRNSDWWILHVMINLHRNHFFLLTFLAITIMVYIESKILYNCYYIVLICFKLKIMHYREYMYTLRKHIYALDNAYQYIFF